MNHETILPSMSDTYLAMLTNLQEQLADTNVNVLTASTLLKRNTTTHASKYITLSDGIIFFADAQVNNHLGLLETARKVLHNDQLYPVDLGMIVGGGGFLDFIHGYTGDSLHVLSTNLSDPQKHRRNGKDFNEQHYTEKIVKFLQTADQRLLSIEINFEE